MPASPATPSHPDRRAIRSFSLVAIVVPLVLTMVAVVLQLVWLPTLPDPAAVHWGLSGGPDGYGPAWTFPVITLVLSGVLPIAIGLLCLAGLRRGDRGFTYRFMGAMALWLSVFGAVLMTWSVGAQRGIADAHDAPSVLAPMLVAFVVGIVAGVVGWLVQPKEETRRATTPAGVPMMLAPGERAVWTGSAVMSKVAMAVIGLAMLLTLGAAVLVWFTGDATAGLVVAVVFVVVATASVTSTAFHVRIDEEGLTVRSEFGLPKFNVPLADIASAEEIFVSPMGMFGGWGMRWAPGRFGVVLRTGPAIEVTRHSGKQFVVTVDDAETGASLLAALAARAAQNAN